MKSYNDKVKFMYKILSKIYDLMYLICFPIKSRNPHLGLAKNIPNDSISVLDICCGTGNTLIAIASRNEKNKVRGIDLSVDMLKIAQNKLKRLEISNAHVQEMDATKLKMEDNTFEIITTSLSLHEMPEDIFYSVLSEMSRVTKKDGKVCIIEWDRPTNVFGAFLFGIFPFLLEPRGFREFLMLDWNKLLNNYGLTVIEIQKYTFSKLIIAIKE